MVFFQLKLCSRQGMPFEPFAVQCNLDVPGMAGNSHRWKPFRDPVSIEQCRKPQDDNHVYGLHLPLTRQLLHQFHIDLAAVIPHEAGEQALLVP